MVKLLLILSIAVLLGLTECMKIDRNTHTYQILEGSDCPFGCCRQLGVCKPQYHWTYVYGEDDGSCEEYCAANCKCARMDIEASKNGGNYPPSYYTKTAY